ncbi:MAG: hypothetical protein ACYS5V_14335, partial [Planctomycetota bacterium]
MTQRERFLATVSGRKPEGILYTAGFTPDLQRRLVEHAGTEDLAGHYGFFSPVHIGLKPPDGWRPPDYSVYYTGEELPEGTTINSDGVAMIPAGFYHFARHHSPLRNARSIEQIQAYPIPGESEWPAAHMAEDVAAAHAAGRVAVGSIGHMYETSWQIRGYEEFLVDMIDRPE